MEEKRKILIVHNYYQLSGGEDTVVQNEKDLLEEHGNKVLLYSRNNLEMKNISGIGKLLLPFIVVFNFRTYWEIQKLIKKEKIDIVHVHNTLFFISPSVYYAAVKCRIPVVQTIHNFRLLCPNAIFYRNGHICEECLEKGLNCAIKYKCYRGSRMQTLACVISMKIHRMTGIYKKINYICLTEFNKNKLSAMKQIAFDRIFVKPNFGKNVTENVSFGKRENQYIFVGRLEKLKGIDKLLAAWKVIERRKCENIPQLIVCGTGPLKEWCKSYITENELKHVRMYGNVPNTEVKKRMAASKALIFPTQCYEGFPMVMAEAYSVGTPVIGSGIGNTKALIIEGKTGEEFVYDSPESLVGAVDRFESGSQEEYQRNAYSFYKNNLTSEINYRQLVEIYRSLKE